MNTPLKTALSSTLLMALASGAWAQMPPASVSVEEASRQDMASTVVAPGTIVSRNDARVAAEISGRLTWVSEVGEVIEAGKPIARIDDRELQLLLKNNEATVRRLEANHDYLKAQLERFEKLSAQNNAARNEVDEARAQIEMSEQDIVAARVAREQTLLQIERSQILAPFSGQITERFAQSGEYTTAGTPIVRLVDTTNIEVRAQAPMSVASFLRDGMGVNVRDGRYETRSVIRSVIPVGDERSRMIEVRVALDGVRWAIGSAVRVDLPKTEPSSVVAVPRDALILRENSTYLFRVTDENTVEQVPVEAGVGSGSLIEVRGDIADGDRVVTRGGERLRAGQAVVIGQDS